MYCNHNPTFMINKQSYKNEHYQYSMFLCFMFHFHIYTGTTGETLSILTSSLKGLDHKLHLILNKADQFRKIHDFARAYGSLCWNLSKVIPRKDLPVIYTMCLPIGTAGGALGTNSTVVGSEEGTSVNDILLLTESYFLRQGYADLEESRMEVTREVFNAPKRRGRVDMLRIYACILLLISLLLFLLLLLLFIVVIIIFFILTTISNCYHSFVF